MPGLRCGSAVTRFPATTAVRAGGPSSGRTGSRRRRSGAAPHAPPAGPGCQVGVEEDRDEGHGRGGRGPGGTGRPELRGQAHDVLGRGGRPRRRAGARNRRREGNPSRALPLLRRSLESRAPHAHSPRDRAGRRLLRRRAAWPGFATVGESISLVWPPTGIAIAALVLLGPRYWPAWRSARSSRTLVTAAPAVTAAAASPLGNTLEALLGA